MIRTVNIFLCWLLLLQPFWTIPETGVSPAASSPTGFLVRYHPDGGLRVGDWVSIQVVAPPGFSGENARLLVNWVQAEKKSLGESGFGQDGTGRQVATLQWAWDTRGLAPGSYVLQFVINAGAQTWQESVRLLPAQTGPEPVWIERETACCRLHVISGTAAARDLERLAQVTDARASVTAAKMGYRLEGSANGNGAKRAFKKLDVNLIPRVLGQGGFAGEEVTVSYDDRLYTNMDVETVIQHELVHRIDAELGGDLRPTLLAEGLAVYLAGGHYKPEPIIARAVNLLRQGTYLPLPILAENFYEHQHELSYLQAAALVDFMVRTWGWEAFNRFYRDIHPEPSHKEADAINTALKKHFGIHLSQLDDRFVGFLEKQPVLPDMGEDLAVTTAYYEAIREYQEKFDPSAYFRQVWLPDPRATRQRGITADYLRGPQDEPNLAIVRLLWQAGQAWRSGRFQEARVQLAAVHAAIQEAGQAYPIPNKDQSLKSSITSSMMISSMIPIKMYTQVGVR